MIHPYYKPPARYNDIALIKLDRPVKFNDYIKPICLETNENLNNTFPVATGWGQVGFGGAMSSVLQKVYLEYFTINECKKSYETISKRLLPNGIDEALHVCCGGRNKISDTCPGDSGGPLQVRHSKFGLINTQVGITAFGQGCGSENVPGVYTRIAKYVPWIEEIVWLQI